MSNVWFTSDWHLGHINVTKFEPCRGTFHTIEEHDQMVIDNINSVVTKRDLMWVLGDVAMKKESLALVSQIKCRMKLVLGNHDNFHAKDYLEYFEDVYGAVRYKRGIIMTHIPIAHEESHFWSVNLHGHTHSSIIDSPEYINVCLEPNGLMPVNWEDIKERIDYDSLKTGS